MLRGFKGGQIQGGGARTGATKRARFLGFQGLRVEGSKSWELSWREKSKPSDSRIFSLAAANPETD